MTDKRDPSVDFQRIVPANSSRPDDVVTRRLRVLVADDTPTNCKVIQRILEGRGHDVVTARNGREALYCILYGTCDVVLMDIQMPLMDGYEVTREIRRQEESTERHIPIVALTTHQSDSNRKKCHEAGMDAYLARPIDAAQLLHTIECCANGGAPQAGAKACTTFARAEMKERPSVDFEGCMRRLGGDVDLFREFVEIFREDSPGLLESIRKGAADQDRSALTRGAHSIKGLASNFGARCAVDAAKQLEEIGERSRWNEAPGAVAILEHEISRLHRELDEFRLLPQRAGMDAPPVDPIRVIFRMGSPLDSERRGCHWQAATRDLAIPPDATGGQPVQQGKPAASSLAGRRVCDLLAWMISHGGLPPGVMKTLAGLDRVTRFLEGFSIGL